jgi:hypothetical protein
MGFGDAFVAGQSLPRLRFRYSVPRVPVNDGR